MECVLSFQQGPLIADIAVNVFSFLTLSEKQNVAQVCHYWREIVYLPCFWKEKTVVLPLNPSKSLIQSLKTRRITRVACTRVTEEDLDCLFEYIPGLTHFKFRGCPQVSEGFLQRKIPILTNLQHLSFHECKQVTNKLSKDHSMVSALKNLKSLSIRDCGKIYFAGFRRMIEQLQELESLDLTNCINLDNHCLRILPIACPNLSWLVLEGCEWVSFNGLQYICKMKTLKGLNLRHCHEIADLEDVHLVAVSLPNLEFFKHRETPHDGARNETVTSVTASLPKLKHFAFQGYYNHMNDVVYMLEEIVKLKDLECLELNVESFLEGAGINNSCLLKFNEMLPKLKVLELSALTNLRVETAQVMAEKMPHIESLMIVFLYEEIVQFEGIILLCSQLKNLNSIKLDFCEFTHNDFHSLVTTLGQLESLSLSAEKLTDTSMKSMAKHLKVVTNLSLGQCFHITNAGVRHIVKGMPLLQKLHLFNCHRLTNESAVMIGKHLKNLRELKIEGNKITDKGFIYICQNLSKLNTLLASICKITDKGIAEGAKALSNLEFLEISSNHITDEGVSQAVKCLKGLTDMVLLSCPLITLVAADTILRGLPKLDNFKI